MNTDIFATGSSRKFRKRVFGFTLAELLIAIVILGIIAAFTIPKILESTGNGKLENIAKETACLLRDAFSYYKKDFTPQWDMMSNSSYFFQFVNYVEEDTTTTQASVPDPPVGQTKLQSCSTTTPCILMHTGAIVQYDTGITFGASDPSPNNPNITDFIFFNIDPDGFRSEAGRISIVLFYNGRITTGEKAGPLTPSNNTMTLETTDPPYLDAWN